MRVPNIKAKIKVIIAIGCKVFVYIYEPIKLMILVNINAHVAKNMPKNLFKIKNNIKGRNSKIIGYFLCE